MVSSEVLLPAACHATSGVIYWALLARLGGFRLTIDTDTLRSWLDRGKDVYVLDIRDEDDFADSAVPNSANLPVLRSVSANEPGCLDRANIPSGKPVVTVCYQGVTSVLAAEMLRSKGVEAMSLQGGMQAWSLAWNTAEARIAGSNARVIQVRRTAKGCLSYLIGCGGEALVLDPSVEPEVYVGLATHQGWKITKVLDTHVHADHIMRSRRLADRCDATMYLPAQKRVQYPFQPVKNGDMIPIGSSRLMALYTPGHTWESTCYLLDAKALFSGDTLFTNSVGRPDLAAGEEEEVNKRAAALRTSLLKLLELPPSTLVLPCHSSATIPFDGKPICATMAEVREQTPILALDEEEFVASVIDRIPPTPENHLAIVGMNEQGEFPPCGGTTFETGGNRCAVRA